MKRVLPSTFIRENFEASDRLAVMVVDGRNRATTRISTAEQIASDEYQAWLRNENRQVRDIFLSMNPLSSDASRLTSRDVAEVRHVFLEFNDGGEEAVRAIMDDYELPEPKYVLNIAADRRQVIWRVDGFNPMQAADLQSNLARDWGAEPAATSCAHALRMPGFYNFSCGPSYLVRTEPRNTPRNYCRYSPDQFLEFAPDRATSKLDETIISKPKRSLSPMERDDAHAKQLLARGTNLLVIATTIAYHRRNEQQSPADYAVDILRKAATEVVRDQRRQFDLPTEPDR